ncbi:hypothetical protein [Halorussus halobius]|uniref:hypothetical protein n=1 Tax=Halorussus halobius TaxID=1710537 RepID=UPI0010925A84|nr:hypothetical protein [Halorussus halobius]
MDLDDQEKLRRVLKRIYASFVKDEYLDAEELQLLRRANPGLDDVENTLFAVENDLDQLRERLTIHSEWEPEIPSDDRVIRRYLSIGRFQSLLDESGIWFSRVDGFSDSFEATLPRPNANLRDAVKRWSGRNPAEIDHNERVRNRSDDKTYINCWRVGRDESAVFWDAYLGTEPGVAVETTVGDFRNAIEMSVSDGYLETYRNYVRATGRKRSKALDEVYDELSKLQIGSVEYVDYDEDAIPGSQLSYSRYFHKRNAFEDEREFRAVFEDDSVMTPDQSGLDGAQLHGLLTGKEMDVADSGQYVSIDTDALVNAVVCKPGTSNVFSRVVEQLLTEHGIEAEVTESRLDKSPN